MNNSTSKRTIKNAINIETGEIINADKLDDSGFANTLRLSTNNDEQKYLCCECENEIGVKQNQVDQFSTKRKASNYFHYRLKNKTKMKLFLDNEWKPKDVLHRKDNVFSNLFTFLQ